MQPQMILILGGVLAVFLLIVGVFVSAREEHSLVDQRLGRYLDEQAEMKGSGQKSAPLTDWLNETSQHYSWGEGIAKELARADLKLKVGEYLAVMLISSIGMAAVGWIISKGSIIFAVGGAIIGLFIPRIYVNRQKGKRLVHFSDQLSDMLNLMVNSLRAGYSTMQAMEAVSKELPAPICDEFRRVVQEMQLGVAMEKALDNLLRRIPSPDLDLVVTAINVQREVGGNLAEILDTISHTIRERVRIKGEIRVLTAQQVYSGRLLACLPVILMGAMYLLNRSYFMNFFVEPTKIIGIIALSVAGGLIIAGYFVMDKIAKIEV